MHSIRKGLIKRIHVNQHNIKKNRINQDSKLPIVSVKTSKGNVVGHRVEVNGPSEIVYSPDKPLNCGAVVWIETKSEVNVHE